MGAGERLRESFPDVVVAAAEPLPGDEVMGLRSLDDGYVPPILDVSKLDRKLLVSNADAVSGLKLLLEREGVLGGVSSGAVVHAALRLAEELEEGVVVCVLADGGWKYLSADFWDAPTSRARWGAPSGGDPGPRARGARRARTGRVAERGVRPRRRQGTASRSATSRAVNAAASPTASSSTSHPRRGSSRTRATSSRSSTPTSRRRRAPRGRTSRTSASGPAGRTSSTRSEPTSSPAGASPTAHRAARADRGLVEGGQAGGRDRAACQRVVVHTGKSAHPEGDDAAIALERGDPALEEREERVETRAFRSVDERLLREGRRGGRVAPRRGVRLALRVQARSGAAPSIVAAATTSPWSSAANTDTGAGAFSTTNRIASMACPRVTVRS